MSTFIIVKQELRERWAGFATALGAGLLVLALHWFPGGMERLAPPDRCTMTALAVGASFTLGFALLSGAGMFSRDLEEGRLGFYLARPLGLGALFFGKLMAGLLLAVGSGFLALLPALLVYRVIGPLDLLRLLGLLLSGALLLILLAHALSISLRSRRRWILMELGALLLFAWGSISAALQLERTGAIEACVRLLPALFLGLLLLLAFTGWLQLERGRVDLRIAHRIQAKVLSAGLLLLLLLVQSYKLWVLNPSLGALTRLDAVSPAPGGNWAFVAGPTWGRGNFEASFLLNAEDGRWLRAGSGHDAAGFTPDGKEAWWLDRSLNRPGTVELHRLRLDGSPQPSGQPLELPQNDWSRMAPSPDGRRLAISGSPTCAIYDATTGRELWTPSKPIVSGTWHWPGIQMRWTGNGRLRIYAEAESRVQILEVDPATGRSESTGSLEVPKAWPILDQDPLQDHLLLRQGPAQGYALALCEGRSGSVVAQLLPSAEGLSLSGRFLADGSLALVGKEKGQERLWILDASGTERKHLDLDLDPGHHIRILGEAAPGHLLLFRFDSARRLPQTLDVDLISGRVSLLAEGLWPCWNGVDRDGPAGPGSPMRRLFTDTKGNLIELSLNGQRRILIQGGRP